MSSTGSVTHWVSRLKAGDPQAAQPLWERYFQRLVGLARARLAGKSRGMADEEDVALSALDSFCRAAEAGRFPRLSDRDDLWQLLVVITDRKAFRHVRHENRRKRGGGKVRHESALAGADSSEGPALDRVAGPEPTPEFAAEVADECRRLLGMLGDAELQQVALMKMEGYTAEEIAGRLGWVPRTVERRLQLIRRIWEQELNP